MVDLHVFRDSERDAGGWVVQKWQFQCDIIIEQPPFAIVLWYKIYKTLPSFLSIVLLSLEHFFSSFSMHISQFSSF